MANPQKKYTPPASNEILAEVTTLITMWDDFISKYEKAEYRQFSINKGHLMEVIESVDKGKDLYYYFHGIEYISEFREVALLCFWIVRLKPFQMMSSQSSLYNNANECFGLYLILSVLHRASGRLERAFKMPSADARELPPNFTTFIQF